MEVCDDGCAWLFGGWGEPRLQNDLWKLDLKRSGTLHMLCHTLASI
jgi:hypothetical protein